MRPSLRFLAILACALPLACSDSSTAPTATAPPVPRLDANPASNGSTIIRFDDWLGWSKVVWYDERLDKIAMVGTYDVISRCGPSHDPAFVPSDWKIVANGNFDGLYRMIVKMSNPYIFIWEGGWDTWHFCAPIMWGTGTLRIVDTDMMNAGPGARAWGATASGQVTDGNGQVYDFKGRIRGVTSPDGIYKENLFMDLKPLP